MAQKRMFNNSVVGSDSFLEMPDSSQNLYFHLSMRADDDGFVDNWKSIMRMTGKKEDDLKILIAKSFVIPFESGVLVIKHWKLNNYIQKDRYKETIHVAEKQQLMTDSNNVYSMYTDCIHSIDKNSIDKNSIDKNSIDKDKENETKKETKNKYGEYKHVLLTQNEYSTLVSSYPNYNELIAYLDEYIEMKGYKAKSHYLCIKKWVVEAVEQKHKKQLQKQSPKQNSSGWDYIDEQLNSNSIF